MVAWYRLETSCVGHKKAVNDIAFEPGGSLIAAGGDDGHLIIWYCRSGEQCQEIRVRRHGHVLRLAWFAYAPPHESSILLFGCSDGTIHQYLYHHATEHLTQAAIYEDLSHEIQSLTYDTHHARVAATAGQSLNVWKINTASRLKLLWNYEHDVRAIARNTHFVNAGQHLLTLFLETHEVLRFDSRDGRRCNSYRLQSRIGTSAVSPDGKFLLVGNLLNGVELYDTTTLSLIALFQKQITVNVPKQVGHLKGSRLMMSGSDRGVVWLWNRDGVKVQDLPHSHSKALIQVVQAFSLGELQRIASASCDVDGRNPSVKIWRSEEIGHLRHKLLKLRIPSLVLYALALMIFAFLMLKYSPMISLGLRHDTRNIRISLRKGRWFQRMY